MAGTAEKGMLRQLPVEGAGGEALLQGESARRAWRSLRRRAGRLRSCDSIMWKGSSPVVPLSG